MKTISELLDKQTRGESIAPNSENKTTKRRLLRGKKIMAEADGNEDAAFAIAVNELSNYIPRLQEFVLSHSEEPAQTIEELIQQVYQLRMQDVADVSEMLDFDNEDAIVHLEEQEDQFCNEHGYAMENFLGELWSPIEIAYNHINKSERFAGQIASNVAGTVLPIVGEKVNRQALIRAAQGKPAGVYGTLASGGTANYNALRDYFRKNPQIAQQVIKGAITDEAQLPGWIMSDSSIDKSKDVIGKKINEFKKKTFKEILPYIILFLVIIAAIVFFATRAAKK